MGAGYHLDEEPLVELLRNVRDGDMQVPEFQRPVVLHDDWVRTLLASVSLGYPIGAVMVLEAGHPGYRFGRRPVQGAPATSASPRRLLVDGQHRVSALFQALAAPGGVAVLAGDELSHRRYYLDVERLAAGGDRDDAVVSLKAADAPGPRLLPLLGVLDAMPGTMSGFADYRIPVIQLPMEATRWTVRVRGGANGPLLSEAFRVDSR